MLTSNVRKAVTVEDDYRAWLKQLRRVCSDVDVPLIFDEVR
jgi:4-aminobutyrate aminotransferase-like enzyme